jgi:hypothetical protein
MLSGLLRRRSADERAAVLLYELEDLLDRIDGGDDGLRRAFASNLRADFDAIIREFGSLDGLSAPKMRLLSQALHDMAIRTAAENMPRAYAQYVIAVHVEMMGLPGGTAVHGKHLLGRALASVPTNGLIRTANSNPASKGIGGLFTRFPMFQNLTGEQQLYQPIS